MNEKNGAKVLSIIFILMILMVISLVVMTVVGIVQECRDFRECDKLDGCKILKCKADSSRIIFTENNYLNKYNVCLLEKQID